MIQDKEFDDMVDAQQDSPEGKVEFEPPDDEIVLENTPYISYHALNGILQGGSGLD